MALEDVIARQPLTILDLNALRFLLATGSSLKIPAIATMVNTGTLA
jgi:hypothetical protein